eukprot:TRINITY_DN28446_c2_g1_i1.p1 TRINITY_DN28446_c2_g1~~TRINITY_DN28446_c2_g1_i1.p1  ORF type:complete len:404 (-),score=51.13 TRINITY_DN28446_c2_g1_i1:190-1401(-)
MVRVQMVACQVVEADQDDGPVLLDSAFKKTAGTAVEEEKQDKSLYSVDYLDIDVNDLGEESDSTEDSFEGGLGSGAGNHGASHGKRNGSRKESRVPILCLRDGRSRARGPDSSRLRSRPRLARSLHRRLQRRQRHHGQMEAVQQLAESSSGFRIESGGCAFCLAWCSCIVQSQLFTGYNPTGKDGIITKVDGPRHILEIDNRPAATVYNEWTGGEWSKFLEDKSEDSNILGPSSLYPLGQVLGEGPDGDLVYRSMHPHLLVKDTMSVTLFSDVMPGEKVVMMTGTKDNIVNRISTIASNIVRDAEFGLPELRGALVVFCAGCMMYASDSMDVCAGKLYDALGGYALRPRVSARRASKPHRARKATLQVQHLLTGISQQEFPTWACTLSESRGSLSEVSTATGT